MLDYKTYIELNPNLRFGKPIIIGTRITVYDVLSWLANGMTIKEIVEDFPELNETQIKACLTFKSDTKQSNNYLL